MFFAISIFIIVSGITASILILMSEKKNKSEIAQLASEFEITEIDA